jgi:hypothetical protein
VRGYRGHWLLVPIDNLDPYKRDCFLRRQHAALFVSRGLIRPAASP